MVKTPANKPSTPKKGSYSSPKKAGMSPKKFKMSPIRKGGSPKYTMKMNIYETKVPYLMVLYASKPKDPPQAAFTWPMMKQFNSDNNGDELAETWKLLGFFPRRNNGQYAGAGHDGEMKSYFGSTYPWYGMVMYNENKKTPTTLAQVLAHEFTSFARNKNLSGMDRPETYTLGTVHEELMHLSWHLLDEDCMVFLKKLNPTATLNELKSDDEVLVQFFGDAEHGRSLLNDLGVDGWEDISVSDNGEN